MASDLVKTARSESLTTLFLSVTSFLEGTLFWFLVPRFIDRVFNLAVPIPILIFILMASILLSYVNLLRYALGRVVRRWQLDIVFTLLIFVIQIAIGELYLLVLPQLTPQHFIDIYWRYLLLPFATIVMVTGLMYRKIPGFREKVERYRYYDSSKTL